MPDALRKSAAYRTVWTACLLVAQSASAQPEGTVQRLHADDATVPVAPYLASLVGGERQEGVLQGLRFPLRTTLRQGVLRDEARQVFDPRWLTQPMAIVGTDWVSRQWLELHQARLHAMTATVIVVAAPSESDFKSLQRSLQGMHLAPAQSPWLQARLQRAGVSVYPVLIGLDGRARQVIFGEGSVR